MAIDLIALKRAADGNPEQQIAVRRKLLQDAYNALTAREGVSPSLKAGGPMARGELKKNANTTFVADDGSQAED